MFSEGKRRAEEGVGIADEATLDAAIHDAVIALNAERNSDPLGNRRIFA